MVAALAFLALSAWTWRYTMDDAFISFRYARHIGDGLGPIWNLADRAQPVEGFTSFLHVWLLGGIRLATGADLPIVAKALGVLAILVLAGCATAEGRRAGLRGPALAVALSFLLLPFTALNAVSGMETPLYLLWHFLCAMACLRMLEQPSAATAFRLVLLGLLGTLTRPEFAAPFLLLCACVAWRCPRHRLQVVKALLLLYVVPGLAVTAWRWSFYGDLVPNPFHVKQGRGPSREGVIYVARFLGLVALPYLMMVAAGWRGLWRSQRNLLLVSAVNLGVALAYFATTHPTMGGWYRFLVPQVPLLAFVAAVSLPGASGATRDGSLLRVAAVVLLAGSTLAHVPGIARFLVFHSAHEARYRELGRRLAPFAAPDRWLNYYDVGSIVYESEWNTIDVVGLNTRWSGRKDPCELATDVLLRFSFQPQEIENPCPGLYVALADLPFSRQVPFIDSYLRVYVRHDVTYADELRQALMEDWPPPLERPHDWVAAYWGRTRSLFFQ